MHVIVTGGSSGIGLEVAKLYAARGARLTLVARDPVKLENARRELLSSGRIQDTDIHIAMADVGRDADVSAAIAGAEAKLGACDVLIASAGIVEPGTFETLSGEAFAAQVTTNLLGTANAVRAVYPGMKARGRGRVMIVSSGAALIGLHGYTAYCASKSALTGFVEALAFEAAGSGVGISVCFPPDTFTPQLEGELAKRPPQAQVLMGKAPPWTAPAVAERIVRAIDRGAPRLYFGFSITALGLFGSLAKPVLMWWYTRKPS
ncbi:SDR family oxidoreductase [Neorhizobium sp. DT-125]|uniref:SDR family oxidoreductase n=1 Tax=Neorhizobium sp. DT-125 TaxID=3396163 RepID=UPI003F1BC6E3